MVDLPRRLRAEVAREPDVGALLEEAAAEIERLRTSLGSVTETMNQCIRDYQKLLAVALDGDTLIAYRLGIKHAMDGEPDATRRDDAR